MRDHEIFYLVLNRPNNLFNFEFLKALSKYFDEVEASEGAVCLVTIGTGPRNFSSGYDLKVVAQSPLVAMDLFFGT